MTHIFSLRNVNSYMINDSYNSNNKQRRANKSISLFTNIPIDLAIDSIANRWEVISANCNIPKEEFIKAVSFVLDSTYFVFNNIFYKQTFGTPMGSPLSLIIADLVMRDLEEKALGRLGVRVPFYFRYVDNIAMAIPSSVCDTILEAFNSFHPRL